MTALPQDARRQNARPQLSKRNLFRVSITSIEPSTRHIARFMSPRCHVIVPCRIRTIRDDMFKIFFDYEWIFCSWNVTIDGGFRKISVGMGPFPNALVVSFVFLLGPMGMENRTRVGRYFFFNNFRTSVFTFTFWPNHRKWTHFINRRVLNHYLVEDTSIL